MPVLRHWLITPESVSAAPAAPPERQRWLLLLHGIYGSGANWRGFARRLVAALPADLGFGAVLVDLRMHGESQGFAPPHTLHAAAADLRELAARLPGPVAAVLGHSFGGKVALRYAELGTQPADSPSADPLKQDADLTSVFVVDSTPGIRPSARGSEGVLRVLEALRGLPAVHDSRESFVAQLVAQGFNRPLAQWLAMNLRGGTQTTKPFRFTLDLDAMAALLADYFVQDLWHVVEHPPGSKLRLHLVIGDRSDVFDAPDRERAAQDAARSGGRVTLDILPAGHFVHVDDPAGLLRLVVAGLVTDAS